MKKRICITICLTTLLFVLGIGMDIKNKSEDIENIAIDVNATPVSSHIVVIDAGHGKPDEGAVGLYGTTEEAINLKIALKLQKLIEQSGGMVYLTRSDENGIYSSDATTIKQIKVSDIKNRVVIANQKDADICVSIHLNKYPDGKYSGWQTFFQEGNEGSIELANLIQESLNETIDTPNNRVPLVLKGIYLMDHVENPTVTVECGFLSNESEVKLLQEEEYQNKLAWGIYIGIQNYFKNH